MPRRYDVAMVRRPYRQAHLERLLEQLDGFAFASLTRNTSGLHPQSSCRLRYSSRVWESTYRLLTGLFVMLTSSLDAKPPLRPVVDVQAHRGGAGLMPESSLAAFRHAVELGVTTLEFDVHMTRDRVLVVHHDPAPNPKLCVEDDGREVSKARFSTLLFDDLATIDCGQHRLDGTQKLLPGSRIPRLEQVLALARDAAYPVRLSIEIKRPSRDGTEEEIVELLLAQLDAYGMKARTIVQSFDPPTLRRVRDADPAVRRSYLVKRRREYDLVFEDGLASILSPRFRELRRVDVERFRARGIAVVPWTVNEPEDIRRILAWGVDGIISDYPDRVLEILGETADNEDVRGRGEGKDEWWSALPRAAWSAFEPVSQTQPWFEVYAIRPGVFAIYEPGQFEEVISYLVVGAQKALLLDTGLGIGDMRRLVGELTDREIVVINSHTHYDHVGGNHGFETIYATATEYTRRNTRGRPHDEVAEFVGEGWIWKETPAGFDAEAYVSRPFTVHHEVADGHVFDLGGVRLEVLLTPGHAPDSLCLLDRENRWLFTGDTIYPATLYTHLPGSSLSDYEQTAERLAALAGDVDFVLPAHNEPTMPARELVALRDAFTAVRRGDAAFVVTDGLREYEFGRFSILASDPPAW